MARVGWRTWRAVLVAAATVAMTLSLVPAAAAAPIVAHENYQEEFTEVDEFWSGLCGTEVVAHIVSQGHFTIFGDGSVKDHWTDWATFSSAYGELELSAATTIHWEPEDYVDNGDGTASIVLDHRQTGRTLKVKIKGEPMAIVDAGWIDFSIVITVVSETGEMLDFREDTLGIAGPHPVFESDFDEVVELFCGALGS